MAKKRNKERERALMEANRVINRGRDGRGPWLELMTVLLAFFVVLFFATCR